MAPDDPAVLERAADLLAVLGLTGQAEQTFLRALALDRATDHGVIVGVDIGHHRIAGRGVHDSLDVGEGAEDGGHGPVVLHRQAGHLPTAGAYRLQGGRERQ